MSLLVVLLLLLFFRTLSMLTRGLTLSLRVLTASINVDNWSGVGLFKLLLLGLSRALALGLLSVLVLMGLLSPLRLLEDSPVVKPPKAFLLKTLVPPLLARSSTMAGPVVLVELVLVLLLLPRMVRIAERILSSCRTQEKRKPVTIHNKMVIESKMKTKERKTPECAYAAYGSCAPEAGCCVGIARNAIPRQTEGETSLAAYAPEAFNSFLTAAGK